MDDRTKIILGAVVGLAVLITAGVLFYSWRIGGTGIIRAVGVKVYGDADQTFEISAIDWGNVTAGDVKAFDLWIENDKNTIVTLTMALENWVPVQANDYLTIGWNYAGNELYPSETVAVTLTMTVADNAQDFLIIRPGGDFAFDIVLTAQGQR